jgi:drug/metabolite transporter (DMT)-like permease
LTTGVFAAVLLAALLHAGWNAFLKSGSDKSLDTALLRSVGVPVALPVVLVLGLPDAAAWPYIAASALVHLGYYATLARAYEHGDLGLTYPVMRGTAPVMVALASGPLIGEALAVCAGVVALGLSPRVLHGDTAKALRFALANAALIAAYTVIDGIGVRASGNAAAYVATLFLANGLPYFTLVLLWRGRGRRREALAYMATRWKPALAGSVASAAAYGIALWAMTRAPVALVAALRETSVLFAALIGALWLEERLGPMRVLGTLLIVAGAVGLRVG